MSKITEYFEEHFWASIVIAIAFFWFLGMVLPKDNPSQPGPCNFTQEEGC